MNMKNSDSKALDKFYTNSDIANKLIDKACDVLGVNRDTAVFLEPSAGAGAFSTQLKNIIAYDIRPESDEIVQADFLSILPSWEHDTISIGNPPFGKKARLAIDFINKCAESTDAICFVLPNTFRRYNTQKEIDKRFALVYDESLREDGTFTFEGNDFSLRCVFQIWIRKDGIYWHDDMRDMRIVKKPPISHPDFICWQHNATMQSRKYIDEDWDVAFWRQGYKDYSRVFRNPDDYDEVRHIMYDTNLQLFLVHFSNEIAKDIIMHMNLDELAKQNLSTPGFGKSDFIAEYIRCKDEYEKKALLYRQVWY